MSSRAFNERFDKPFSILSLIIGSICLCFYFRIDLLVAKVFLYLGSIFFITLGVNQIGLRVESSIRQIRNPNISFAESFSWLVLSLFALYQSYTLRDLTLRVVALVVLFILAFFFLIKLAAAISDTELSKKSMNMSIAYSLLSLLVIGLSWAFRSTEILLFLPLVIILVYTNHIRVNYLRSSKAKTTANSEGTTTLSKRFFFDLSNPLRQIEWITPLLTFVVALPFIIYVKNVLPLPSTMSDLYTVALNIYVLILAIIIALAILILGYLWSKGCSIDTKDTQRALLGLGQMCVVFVLVSFLGKLLGMETDTTVFNSGTTLSDIFHSENSIARVSSLFQILLLEFVILSFPVTFLYLYATVKGFLHQD